MITETTCQTPRVNNIHTEYSPALSPLMLWNYPYWGNIFNLSWMVPVNWDETTQLMTHYPYSLVTLQVNLSSVSLCFI